MTTMTQLSKPTTSIITTALQGKSNIWQAHIYSVATLWLSASTLATDRLQSVRQMILASQAAILPTLVVQDGIHSIIIKNNDVWGRFSGSCSSAFLLFVPNFFLLLVFDLDVREWLITLYWNYCSGSVSVFIHPLSAPTLCLQTIFW